MIFIERDIESAKIDLSLKADFNLVDSFRIFDIKSLGSFTCQNLEDGLQKNLDFGDYLQDDIYMFFRKVDKQNVGHITFRQFGVICILNLGLYGTFYVGFATVPFQRFTLFINCHFQLAKKKHSTRFNKSHKI